MPHLGADPFTESIPLPTDDELGPKTAAYLYDVARNYKDARIMLGAGGVGRPSFDT